MHRFFLVVIFYLENKGILKESKSTLIWILYNHIWYDLGEFNVWFILKILVPDEFSTGLIKNW